MTLNRDALSGDLDLNREPPYVIGQAHVVEREGGLKMEKSRKMQREKMFC